LQEEGFQEKMEHATNHVKGKKKNTRGGGRGGKSSPVHGEASPGGKKEAWLCGKRTYEEEKVALA